MHGVTRTTTIAIKTLVAISLRDLFVIGKGSSSVGSATEKVKKAKAMEIVLVIIPEI